MQRQKDPALLEFMADRRAQFFERAGMDTMGRKLATVANEINTAARSKEGSQTENPIMEVNDKQDKNSKPVETTEKDEEPNHVIPKFVLYLLREFDSSKMTLLRIICDSYSGDSYFRPERRRRCLMCFDSDHSTENCQDGFLCLNCFHTHEIGGKCKCFCYLKSLEKSSRKIFSGRTSKFETMNRILEINERRIHDFGIGGRKGGAADGARNTGTSDQNQLDDVSDEVVERPEQETIQDEPSNHVIPKFVLYLLREFDCSKITLVRMIKDYYLGRPGEVCLVCFDGHHRTLDCKDEFLCLACFHNHRMEAKCSCFCYLSTIEKSPKKIIMGKFETSIRRTRMELSELNKKRIRVLTEYINTMKSMPPLPEKQSVAPPSDPLKVPGLMDLTFFEAPNSGSPGPTPVPPPPSLTSIATPAPNPVPPPPSMVPAPASALVPPPPVIRHESSPLVSESLGFGELWIDFKFLDFEYSSHINFASALENESLRVRASKNDTCANIKLSLFNMLRRHSIEPTVAGTVTLIMPETLTEPATKLVDGRYLDAYLTEQEQNVTLKVEFRNDLALFRSGVKKASVKHPLPPWDGVLTYRGASLRTLVGDLCVVCLAERHSHFECLRFYCLGCFHYHDLNGQCGCRCVKQYLAATMFGPAFDPKAIEIWNCERIVSITKFIKSPYYMSKRLMTNCSF